MGLSDLVELGWISPMGRELKEQGSFGGRKEVIHEARYSPGHSSGHIKSGSSQSSGGSRTAIQI